jgi:hypothetical protein
MITNTLSESNLFPCKTGFNLGFSVSVNMECNCDSEIYKSISDSCTTSLYFALNIDSLDDLDHHRVLLSEGLFKSCYPYGEAQR